MHEIGADQQVGRVIKALGNRRMLVFCNDNQQRICKIRGAIKKGNWISNGDIVLLSVREEMGAGSAGGGSAKADISDERGDILEKYDHSILGKLKKEPGINPKLFVQLETMDVSGKAAKALENLNEDGEEDFFEDGGEDEEEEKHESKPKSKSHRKDIVKDDDGDIDIDAI